MQKFQLRLRNTFIGALIIASIMFGCNNDESLTPEQSKAKTEVAAQDNSEILAATQEVLDVTSIALLEKGVSNGRTSSGGRLSEHGFNCYPTISANYDVKKTADSLVYSGTISIDFGDGSSCEDSTKVRSGKITDVFRLVVTYNDSIPLRSTEVITFENYKKDSVELDGLFTSSYSSDGTYAVDINDATLTYEDGTSANWSGSLVYLYDNKGTHHWNDDTKTLSGSLNGTTREGDKFTTEITKDILFSYECEGKHDVPVSGTVSLTVGGTTSEVDYGDGTCDRIYSITANGETTEYTFGKKNS
ncbi:MAG TPA: hypothetical protein VFW11_07140 [Cyclobacteriaceae bacterium]|nr:hypothetical protein [Cyclobacteriaceae bacterium]